MKKFILISSLLASLTLGAAENAGMNEFVWNELATSNVPRAKEFYGKVFGWEFEDVPMGDMNYTMIRKNGGKDFGGIWAIPADIQSQVPPHWLSYILVENVEQSLEKARQNGATVVKPVQKAGDKGFFAIITDPTGAHVALWQANKK